MSRDRSRATQTMQRMGLHGTYCTTPPFSRTLSTSATYLRRSAIDFDLERGAAKGHYNKTLTLGSGPRAPPSSRPLHQYRKRASLMRSV